MSDNATFLVSLLKIPYFAQLAADKGEDWLADVFADMETSDYDFSPFEDLISGAGEDTATGFEPAAAADIKVDVEVTDAFADEAKVADSAESILSAPANVVDGAGNDTITGGAGNDIINGGSGADHMTGGDSKDEFVYGSVSDTGATDDFDFISDFDVSDDVFDLTDLSLTDVFVFKGTAAFAGGGELGVRYVKTSTDTMVQIDTDGDGTADMQIELDGSKTLTSANFDL
jgi:Ca2+-binding RTX toxin-like protein